MLFPSCVLRTNAGTKNEYNGIKITSDASFLIILFDLILLLKDGVQNGCQYIINQSAVYILLLAL